jgi:putative ABC transport system permease protein
MKTFSLALRNLLRNRRRSLTTLLAMVVGLVAILIFGGYRSNIIYGMQTGFVQSSGHLQIQHTDYFLEGGDNPTAYGIPDYPRIIEAVRADPVLAPMLNAVTPTLQLGGIAGNFSAGVSRSVMALGVVAEERNQMLLWNEYGMHSYALPLAAGRHVARLGRDRHRRGAQAQGFAALCTLPAAARRRRPWPAKAMRRRPIC